MNELAGGVRLVLQSNNHHLFPHSRVNQSSVISSLHISFPKHVTFHTSFITVSLSGEFLSHQFSLPFPPRVNLICCLKHKVCFVWSSGITRGWVSDTYGGKAGWINRLSIWCSLRDVLWSTWLNIAWPEEQEWWVITNTSKKETIMSLSHSVKVPFQLHMTQFGKSNGAQTFFGKHRLHSHEMETVPVSHAPFSIFCWNEQEESRGDACLWSGWIWSSVGSAAPPDMDKKSSRI